MEIKSIKITSLRTSAIIFIAGLFVVPSSNATDYKIFHGTRFVKIAPGCFQMGRDKSFKESLQAELPTHKVCIEKGFWLGETEVTQDLWEDVMGNNPSKFKLRNNPVERVSWNEVQEFIQHLNKLDSGNNYRLPTEAEWEYAARAGSRSVYSFGDDPEELSKYAWFGNEGYRGSSKEVAKKKPNAWGLYDMHGNVWEWVQDFYNEGYYANSPTNDPKGPEAGQYRVYRGGSWVSKAFNLRSALRYSGLPVTRSSDIGFRLVKEE